MINDSKMDHLIDEIIKEEITNAPKPSLSVEEAWEQIQQRLKDNVIKQRTAFKLPKPTIYVASIILILFITIFSVPSNSFAFSKLTEIIHQVRGTFTQIFIKSSESEGKEDNVPEFNDLSIVEGSEVRNIKMDLEASLQITDFSIILPKEIPSEFQLEYVTVLKRENEEKSREIYLHYKNRQRSFSIYETIYNEALGIGQIVDREDNLVEMTKVNGLDASIIIFKDNTTKLSWIDQSIYYSIEGQLTKKEIIQLAESM